MTQQTIVISSPGPIAQKNFLIERIDLYGGGGGGGGGGNNGGGGGGGSGATVTFIPTKPTTAQGFMATQVGAGGSTSGNGGDTILIISLLDGDLILTAHGGLGAIGSNGGNGGPLENISLPADYPGVTAVSYGGGGGGATPFAYLRRYSWIRHYTWTDWHW